MEALSTAAIVGIGGRFPGARDHDELWTRLIRGETLITEVPGERWRGAWRGGLDEPQDAARFRGGFIEHVDCFDAAFFGIAPREAQLMDPQQRLLLQVVWHALEDACITPSSLAGERVGVFIGACNQDYSELADQRCSYREGHLATGTQASILANRLSHYFDWRGPSVTLDTACSSSLVAVHFARQALARGECTLAVAGGVNICWTPKRFIAFGSAGMLSPDGVCRTFDAAANGYVRGEGVAAVLLKPAGAARRDGNRIRALLVGSGVNHGGRTGGLTVTNAGQQAVLAVDVMREAGVAASSIGFIETHGTGTALGDPIEVLGLKEAFARRDAELGDRSAAASCALGSIKCNIGHLEAAAGIAGLIKVAFAVSRGQIPGHPHLQQLNPLIALDGSPFHVPRQLTQWDRPRDATQRELPRRAAVSSFGFGGAYAHALVEEALPDSELQPLRVCSPPWLFCVSARSRERLRELCAELAETVARLKDESDDALASIAYTLQSAREEMQERLALLAGSGEELTQKLRRFARNGTHDAQDESGRAVKRSGPVDGEEQQVLLARRAWRELAARWVRGESIDWRPLYGNQPPAFASLPLYPFARQRHWLDDSPTKEVAATVLTSGWRAKPLTQTDERVEPAQHWVFAPSECVDKLSAFRTRAPRACIRLLGGEASDPARRIESCAEQLFGELQALLSARDHRTVLVQLVAFDAHEPGPMLGTLAAMLRCAALENPRLQWQALRLESADTPDAVRDKLSSNALAPDDTIVRYAAVERQVAELQPLHVDASDEIPWRAGGVYWIVGGGGALGLLLAGEIASRAPGARIVLSSRSPQGEATSVTHVEYAAVDVTDGRAVEECSDEIVRRHGALDGIVNCAGVLADAFLVRQPVSALGAVLAPKVAGTLHLEQAARRHSSEFLILFSSLAGVIGNAGQAAYAAANAFMDHHAIERQASGPGQPRLLSMSWPFWAQGGMRSSRTDRAMLSSRAGFDALYAAWNARVAHAVVLAAGDSVPQLQVPQRAAESQIDIELSQLRSRVLERLRAIFCDVLGVAVQSIDPGEPFDGLGIDSIFVMKLNEHLSAALPKVSRTLLFQYRTLGEVCDALLAAHPADCARWCNEPATAAMPAPRRRSGRNPAPQEPIAIIGLAGRYPRAPTLGAFWNNLVAGTDCISELTDDRWALDDFFEPDLEAAAERGRSYCKWGGFLEDFAAFDPLFFGISPRDALNMDPQERLFLEVCWEVLEDAGYTRASLARCHSGRVGVYVGVTNTGFEMYRPQLARGAEPVLPHTSFSSVANRVSYLLDLHGPSLSIDTMCSASLTAVHEACEHLLRGECELAIAGGVNLYLHPSNFFDLCRWGMLSPDGRCRSFGAGANGFVPGEGVGAVLLKPLSRAIADGDNIHAVIRATAVNHGGRTRGYTVPSPTAQCELIRTALAKAGISAREVSYVEAHGTGTLLGDPIEVTGLTQAFAADTAEKQFCALGSVKSNIGHLESAAGIAGLTKVVLQMKHRLLVPSLHARQANPNIDFAETAFRVPHELQPWEPTTDTRSDAPLIAGISSFGAGGANAHVLIEEYRPSGPVLPAKGPRRFSAIVLSARSVGQLQEQAQRLLQAVQERAWTDEDVPAIAHTLQVGREAMEHRVACSVAGIDELVGKLAAIGAGNAAARDEWCSGKATRETDVLAALGHEVESLLCDPPLSREAMESVLRLWVQGAAVDWQRLVPDCTARRISLPTYPFLKETYWPELGERTATVEHHPLLQQVPSAGSQCYRASFTGSEPFLRDHVVQGRPVFPGVVQLEMVRAAACHSLARVRETGAVGIVHLANVVWLRPIDTRPAASVNVWLTSETNGTGKLAFKVSDYDGGAPPDATEAACTQGTVELRESVPERLLDLASLRRGCDRAVDVDGLYARLRATGLEYGASYRAIQELDIGNDAAGNEFAVAQLAVPAAVAGSDRYCLHPSVMDGALQAVAALACADSSVPSAPLPFTLRSMTVFAPTQERALAYVRAASVGSGQMDLDICDPTGRVCVELRGLVIRSSAGKARPAPAVVLLAPRWRIAATLTSHEADVDRLRTQRERWLLCDAQTSALADRLQQLQPDVHCEALAAAPDVQASLAAVFERVRAIVRDAAGRELAVQLLTAPADAAGTQDSQSLSCASGLFRTISHERRRFHGQVIEIDRPAESAQVAALLERAASEQLLCECKLRLRNADIEVRRYEPLPATREDALAKWPWRSGGVYLITGGAGRLGLEIAKLMVATARAPTVILAGRSALSAATRAHILNLARDGARVEYRQLDVGDEQSTRECVQAIIAAYGRLDGIVHSAAVVEDGLFALQRREDLHAVLAGKVVGLLNLDRVTRDVPLEFLLLFSSLAGTVGNAGQSAYAVANAFLDDFAARRNRLRERSLRHGRCLSLAWPLWADGGMRPSEDNRRELQRRGHEAIATAAALAALRTAWTSGESCVLVACGDPDRWRDELPGTDTTGSSEVTAVAAINELRSGVQGIVKRAICTLLKVRPEDVEPDAELSELGFDSIGLTQLGNRLNAELGLQLLPTVFFEFPTLRKLAGHLAAEHREQLAARLSPVGGEPSPPRALPAAPAASVPAPAPLPGNEPIAIIGLSGCFPRARDVDELWSNLDVGRDCITEIPRQRWDWRATCIEAAHDAERTPLKWGGFIDGVDEFDASFFGISMREAELMDPQQRLLMTHVWKLIEDAGYSARSLAGTRTGIFIATADSGYAQLVAQAGRALEGYSATGGIPSVGPNRMSYFLDLHGPSEPIETSCSSSLVAIHRGVRAIRNGDCAMALVGGINTILTPREHVSFSKAGMLSPTGRCRTFSKEADGYVRGEGVALLFLKPLSAAERDGDCIHAVIRGSSENHGGRASSLTAPNPHAQTSVIKAAYADAGVDARTVSYIEAHGTGTPLGDPIEIRALKTAFAELGGAQWQPETLCGIGSAKSSIGHLELAAGAAGVIKVLLQMRHKRLTKSLHCQHLNPYIELEDSPFFIVREAHAWEAPMDDAGRTLPRRAGVSSFGFGGVNAHVVLEEYVRSAPLARAPLPVIIVLSARTEECLRARIRDLLSGAQSGAFAEAELVDVAYTLQVGREAMEYRFATVVSSLAELIERAGTALREGTGAHVYFGQARDERELLNLINDDEEMLAAALKGVAQRKYSKVLSLWVQGVAFDWGKLYDAGGPYAACGARRVRLPTYAFAPKRCWVDGAQVQHGPVENPPRVRQAEQDRLAEVLQQLSSGTLTADAAMQAMERV